MIAIMINDKEEKNANETSVESKRISCLLRISIRVKKDLKKGFDLKCGTSRSSVKRDFQHAR